MTPETKINKQNKMAYWVAGGAALLGAVLMQRQVGAQVEQPRQERLQETYRVVVARRDLKAGTELDPKSDLELAEVRLSRVPRNIYEVGKVEEQTGAAHGTETADPRWDFLQSELFGRALSSSLAKGDLLLRTDFEAGTEFTLDAILPAGQRAVSVVVDRSATMNGLLLPNARVDVVAFYRVTTQVQGKQREGFDKAQVILRNVTVLAIGGRLSRMGGASGSPGGDNSVVLGLDPDQALILSLVQRNAQISLLVRPQGATGDYSATEIDQQDIMDLIEGLKKKSNTQP